MVGVGGGGKRLAGITLDLSVVNYNRIKATVRKPVTPFA